jgi:hypothetical protein
LVTRSRPERSCRATSGCYKWWSNREGEP